MSMSGSPRQTAIRPSAAIPSPPRRKRPAAIELAIERLDDGEVSPFFHDVAEVGDAIELRGPIGGHFVWDVADGGPLLLLGGGSGIVPLMSMLRHRAAEGSRVPALLLFSSRTFEDVIFRDELLALDAKNDGFQLALALTRDTAAARAGFRPPRRREHGRRACRQAADATAPCLRLRRQSVRRGCWPRRDRRRLGTVHDPHRALWRLRRAPQEKGRSVRNGPSLQPALR